MSDEPATNIDVAQLGVHMFNSHYYDENGPLSSSACASTLCASSAENTKPSRNS